MAESCISVDQNYFSCPVCLDLPQDPVTIPCGHSYCYVCINVAWNREDFEGIYKCPECRATFTPRPVLNRTIMLAEVVEKLKKTELQAASSAYSYAGPGDVVCDSCTERKHKAVKSCLVCLASYCKVHLQPHYQSPAFKKHKLIEACTKLHEKICSEHAKLKELYCRTDQSFICYLCMMEKHKWHDTVTAKAGGTKKRSFPSLCGSPGCDDLSSFAVNQQLSFDEVSKYLSDMKKQVEEICEEFSQIHPQAADVQMILPSEQKSREEFLQHFCYLTLDPNTAHPSLVLTEGNRMVTRSRQKQQYTDHPERFDSCCQVLCKESVCGCCYWEVKWTGDVEIAVSYKQIGRKRWRDECLFGFNSQSWSLHCFSSSASFWHNDVQTKLQGPVSSRIGVYVDHTAGTLSFYSVSDSLWLLYRVHTTFTRPLYAGFRIRSHDSTLHLL